MTKEEHIRQLMSDPIYAIMGNAELSLGRSNIDAARQLIEAGVTIIQYREKHKTWREKYAEATAIAALCHDHKVTFIMNDSVDLAIACGADGIHVGQDDAPATVVRRLAGPDMVIGVSALAPCSRRRRKRTPMKSCRTKRSALPCNSPCPS